MRFAFYGDDFTGSVDALLQFRRAGLHGVLVTEAAALTDPALAGAEVAGVAGVSRSLPTSAMRDEVVPALRHLLAQKPQVVQYKACSTADSSPQIGSLGQALELALDLMPHRPVPICLAQPDFGRYTFFGHHFARDDDGIVYRLDRQPTMWAHPATPATESDLRRLLGTQTDLPVGSITWPLYDDDQQLAKLLRRDDVAAVICDAYTDHHLDQLADAILSDDRRPRFVLGSGGLSAALGRTTDLASHLPPLPTSSPPADGPVLVLSGSRSTRTAHQIQQAVDNGWTAFDLLDPRTPKRAVAAHMAGANVIVASTVAARREAAASSQIDQALAETGSRCLKRNPALRLVVCGGDTSGQVLRRLGILTLTVQAAPWGNVALCRARRAAGPDVDVVLKGGQMGHLSLFEDVRTGNSIIATNEPAAQP